MADRKDITGSISSVYSVVGNLFDTPTCQVLKAQEVATGTLCGLVVPKAAQSVDISAASIDWVARASEVMPALLRINSYGIDSNGLFYACVPPVDSEPYCKTGLSAQEAERRFVSLLRSLKKVHESGVTIGDLSPACLRLDRLGSLQFLGVLGGALAAHTVRQAGLISTLAPEFSSGVPSGEPSTDVFSLGHIAALIFTGKPYEGGSVASRLKEAPIWLDVIVERCLQQNPHDRFQTAGEILLGIDELRQKAVESAFVPAAVESDVTRANAQNTTRLTFHRSVGSQSSDESETPEAVAKKSSRKLLIGGGVVTVVILGGFLYSFLGGKPEQVVALKDGTQVVVREGLSPTESAFLDKNLNDPSSVTYSDLLQQLQGIPSAEMRVAVESAIIQYIKGAGSPLLGVQLEQYFAKVRAKVAPDGYLALIRSAEPGKGLEQQGADLREAYAVDPESTLRIAAALAIDSKKLPAYREMLGQLVGDRLQLDSTEQYSVVGLLLLPEDLALFFAEAIFAESSMFRDEELPKLLTVLAERKDLSLRNLVSLTLDRGLVGSIPSVFLEVIRERRDLSPEILSALVKGAVGTLESGNLDPLGQWFDPDAPRVLMAALATAKNPVVVEEAMDLLSGKGVTEEPAATFLEYVRKSYWEKRSALGPVVGVFAFLDRATEEVIKDAVEKLAQFAGDKDLIRQVLMTNNAVVAPRIIKRFPEYIELGTKLELLNNPSKEIRLAAVESIDTNDVGALKLINDAYKSEQDAEVKQAYQRFWTISNKSR